MLFGQSRLSCALSPHLAPSAHPSSPHITTTLAVSCSLRLQSCPLPATNNLDVLFALINASFHRSRTHSRLLTPSASHLVPNQLVASLSTSLFSLILLLAHGQTYSWHQQLAHNIDQCPVELQSVYSSELVSISYQHRHRAQFSLLPASRPKYHRYISLGVRITVHTLGSVGTIALVLYSLRS